MIVSESWLEVSSYHSLPVPVLHEHFGTLDDDLVLVLDARLARLDFARARARLATLSRVGHLYKA